jgi:hypothetical protein
VIGEAVAASKVGRLADAVEFDGSLYPIGCRLKLGGLCARDEGVEIRELVPELNVFPDKDAWSIRLRRVLVPLDRHDAAMLHRRLAHVMREPKDAISKYLQGTPFEETGRAR